MNAIFLSVGWCCFIYIYIYEKIRYIQIAFVIVVVGMCSFFVVVGGCSFVGRSVNEREREREKWESMKISILFKSKNGKKSCFPEKISRKFFEWENILNFSSFYLKNKDILFFYLEMKWKQVRKIKHDLNILCLIGINELKEEILT